MIGVLLVDQPDFDPAPNRERPVEWTRSLRRVCPIDLRHQMLPLETIALIMAVIMAGGSALRRGGQQRWREPASCRAAHTWRALSLSATDTSGRRKTTRPPSRRRRFASHIVASPENAVSP
jgi:hypothetical protein